MLIVSKKLGGGAEANVYEARFAGTETALAVKIFKPANLIRRPDTAEKEYKLLKQFSDHSNVLNVYDFAKGDGKVQIPNEISDDFDVLSKASNDTHTSNENATYLTMELCKMDLFDLVTRKVACKDEMLM